MRGIDECFGLPLYWWRLPQLCSGYFFSHRSTTKLTEKDTIVLADFDKRTGDPLFDDTLKQALAIQLEQSPFLNVLSDQR